MKSIMVIDDDKAGLRTTDIRLTKMGYTVFTATDAASALSSARKNNPDVILMDVSGAPGDALLVSDRLGDLLKSAVTPVIFIAPRQTYSFRECAARLRANGRFLKKPFDSTSLADAIESE